MAKEINKKDNNKKDNKKEEKVTKNNSNVKGMRAELKKVTWPTKKELINNTSAVIGIVILTAIIVFFLDVVFESLSTYGINRLRTVVSEKVNNEVTATEDAEEEVVTDTDTNQTDTSAENSNEVTDETSDVTSETESTTVETGSETEDATTQTPTTEE